MEGKCLVSLHKKKIHQLGKGHLIKQSNQAYTHTQTYSQLYAKTNAYYHSFIPFMTKILNALTAGRVVPPPWSSSRHRWLGFPCNLTTHILVIFNYHSLFTLC